MVLGAVGAHKSNMFWVSRMRQGLKNIALIGFRECSLRFGIRKSIILLSYNVPDKIQMTICLTYNQDISITAT